MHSIILGTGWNANLDGRTAYEWKAGTLWRASPTRVLVLVDLFPFEIQLRISGQAPAHLRAARLRNSTCNCWPCSSWVVLVMGMGVDIDFWIILVG